MQAALSFAPFSAPMPSHQLITNRFLSSGTMAPAISIIGAGNAGAALAVFLRKQGHSVHLTGTTGHPGIIPQIEANGGRLTEVNGAHGLHHERTGTTVQVNTGTIAHAVQTKVIIITVPLFAQEDVIHALSPHDLSGRTLIFLPCGVAAGVIHSVMSEKRMPTLIVGTVSCPFASRTRGDAKIAITRTKKQLEIAASKPVPTRFRKYLESLFPQPIIWYQDLASLFFSNVNPVIHPATMLVSRRQIEAVGPNPLFYEECMPAAEQRIQSVDRERCALANALGLQTNTLHGFFRAWYTPNARSYMDSVRSTPTYKGRRAPGFQHRYIIEDVKFLIVFMRSIAERAKFPTPHFDWIVKEASSALGEDLWRTGKRLSSFRLEEASLKDIIAWLNGHYETERRIIV
eukprot:TRINITY_DN36185_c0_g1_i1.p1 TRINITY_DN36185_c0_g1~~TRINITY_DN36185_c0_g1_i1.p1  ORF type:complete len:402 (-),score=36.21 TRINITY_DN36185_c0_g1_i1:193-1398(-)